ncbi:MAG TPA: hypothetical protein VFR81_28495, partial [Longimicrobium sp.]|nr:hypothetical protein [Longimicrobium sp.]
MTRSEASPLVRTALDEADRRDRMARVALLGAALVEALLLGTALLVMDFGDRTHLLVFVLSVLGYTTLALGLVVIGARS